MHIRVHVLRFDTTFPTLAVVQEPSLHAVIQYLAGRRTEKHFVCILFNILLGSHSIQSFM
jgi:hypothetical protein